MTRYLRLYASFVRFSLSRAMEFQFDFFFRIFMDCIYYAVNILFFRTLFLHTDQLAGWSEAQVMVFVAGYLLSDGIQMTLFANNLWWIPQYINRGDLDYYLLRPVSSLFMVSLRDFAANSLVNFFIASGIFIFTLLRYPEPLVWWKVLGFVALIINGALLVYLIRMCLILVSFWTQSPRGLDEIYWTLGQMAERPDGIFKGAIRIVFRTVIPLFLIASFPARFLFEDFSWMVIGNITVATLAFFGLLLFLWKKGLKNYSSASS